MRNTKQPVVRLLFNTLTTADVGLYEDYKAGKKVMTFKKHGVQIYGDTYTGSSNTPAASGTKNANMQVAKSVTSDGKKKMVLLRPLGPAPCVACDWTYYLSLRERVKLPGVRNSKSNLQQKTYNGSLNIVETTGAAIDDAYLEDAEDDLITQIHNDTGLHQPYNSDAISSYAGSIVYAKRAYVVTLNGANTDKVNIQDDDGSAVETIDLDGGTTVITAVNDFNDDNSKGLTAIALSATTMLVWGTAGQLYTLADGGGGTTVTMVRWVLFEAKDVNVQFDVIFEPGEWYQKGVYMEVLDCSTVSTSAVTMLIDGAAAAAATASTSVANLVTELNTDAGGSAYASIAATGTTDIYVYSDSALVTSFEITLGATSTVVFSADHDSFSAMGQYPSLTSDDIFRIFANQKDAGSRSAFTRLDQPLADTDYVKYHIIVKNQEVSGLHGASYNATHESEFEIYVRASLVDDNIWDATNAGALGARYTYMDESTVSGFVADTTFEGLLAILVGVAPSSW